MSGSAISIFKTSCEWFSSWPMQICVAGIYVFAKRKPLVFPFCMQRQ